ncbi:MAG: hypothetical protein R3C53_22455, partial [Pirellulaceae bacterium]
WCICTYPALCRASPELAVAAQELGELAGRMNIAPSRMWDLLLQLSVDTPANRELAERAMIRAVAPAVRSDSLLTALTSSIATVKSRFIRDFPEFAKDMKLRTEPIRCQWEAYGPGLQFQIATWTQDALMADEAEVLLVQPIMGGMGYPHLQTNRCHVEAILTNADPQLTESVRIAWLLSQLEFERPIYSDLINAFRLRATAGLAMLPPTLQAADELGICPFSPATVQRAIELWKLTTPTEDPAALTQIVLTWWETVEASQPDWRIALTGLDRMLGAQ